MFILFYSITDYVDPEWRMIAFIQWYLTTFHSGHLVCSYFICIYINFLCYLNKYNFIRMGCVEIYRHSTG